MTLDLNAIKARANAATEGPWGVKDARVFGDDGRTQVCTLSGTRAWLPDAEFIAHARTDVPALVAEVERLRGVVDRVRENTHVVRHALHLTGELDAREVIHYISTALEES